MMNYTNQRIISYCESLNCDLDFENPDDLFKVDPTTGKIYFWDLTIPQPDETLIVKQYPDRLVERKLALKQLRGYRNALLKSTDSLIINDIPVDENDLAAIKTYRQSLRDLPQTVDAKLLTLDHSGRLKHADLIPPLPELSRDYFKGVKNRFSFLNKNKLVRKSQLEKS